jgi:alpha-tubulin suppressor-like RCC1 family protein
VIDIKEDRFFELKELAPGTCYYVVVTAENLYGEGYRAQPTLVRTLAAADTDACTPYVWGSNASSEIGLSDCQVMQYLGFYTKCGMRKVLRNDLFEANSVLQMACGNTSSAMLIVNSEKAQSVIFQG